MLNAEEAARRRDLQQRAYAAGGGLTDAEAAELRALNQLQQGRAAAATAGSSGDDVGAAWTTDVARPTDAAASTDAAQPTDAVQPTQTAPMADAAQQQPVPAKDATDSGAGSGTPASALASPPSAVSASRSRLGLLAVAMLAAVMVGVGIGWLAFSTKADAPELTAEQAQTRAELEALGEFVPGSVQLQGSEFGADVWVAMHKDGALEPGADGLDRPCLVVTMPNGRRAMDCGIMGDPSAHRQLDLSFDHDGAQQDVIASLQIGLGGRYSATIDTVHEDFSVTLRQQYSPEGQALFDVLLEAGYDATRLMLVGYDGAVPVWITQDEQPCLLVVEGDGIQQACRDSPLEEGHSLDLSVGDRAYSVQSSAFGYTLTVVSDGAPAEGE